MRESPALKIIEILKEKKYNVVIHDPHVNNKENVSFEEAIKDAELILLLTDHNEFKNIAYDKVEKLMKNLLF